MRKFADLLRSFSVPDGQNKKGETQYREVPKSEILSAIKQGEGTGFLVSDATREEANSVVEKMNALATEGKVWEVAQAESGSFYLRHKNDYRGLLLPGEEG